MSTQDRRRDHLTALCREVVNLSLAHQHPGHPFGAALGWRDGLCTGIQLMRRSRAGRDIVRELFATSVLFSKETPQALEQHAAGMAKVIVEDAAEVMLGTPEQQRDGAYYLRLASVFTQFQEAYRRAPELDGPAAWMDAVLVGMVLERDFPDTGRTLFSEMTRMAVRLANRPAEAYEAECIEAAAEFEAAVAPIIDSGERS